MLLLLRAQVGLTLLLLWAAPAFAVDRTVYFITTGANHTTYGLSATATSTCRLVISNPSTQPQTVVLSTTITSVDIWTSINNVNASDPAVTVTGTGSTSGCTVSGCTVSLPASGDTVMLTYSYTTYPTRASGVTSSGQSLRCAGSMLAKDTAQPGYALANGIIVTFTESAAMHTDSTTGGQRTFGGIAIYSQIPVIINRGKPF